MTNVKCIGLIKSNNSKKYIIFYLTNKDRIDNIITLNGFKKVGKHTKKVIILLKTRTKLSKVVTNEQYKILEENVFNIIDKTIYG